MEKRKYKRKIELMRTDTREILEFENPKYCAYYLKVNVNRIYVRLQENMKKHPYLGYYLKYKDDPDPWPHEIIKIKYSTGGYKLKKKVLVKNIHSGLVSSFESIRALAKYLDRDPRNLGRDLRGVKQILIKQYKIQYDTNDVDWDGPCKEIRERKLCPIVTSYQST